MLVFWCLLTSPLAAQNPFQGLEKLFTPPKSYVAQHTAAPLTIDGRLDEAAWQAAPWTDEFGDIEGAGRPRPTWPTRAKLLWNDSTLFIAATLREPQLWATQTHHDDIIFQDNDFEVFINPDNTTHRYFEIEFNARNNTFDLFLPKPYRNGGDALVSWHAAGLRSAVGLAGTLNRPQDQDSSWTLEMALPLKLLRLGYFTAPPTAGTLWRLNFSRVEWDTDVVNGRIVKRQDAAGKPLPEHNWVWSPQGVVDMHYPERWGYLLFAHGPGTVFRLPYAERQKPYLWLVYYRQQAHRRKTGRYAATLAELGVPARFELEKRVNVLALEATNQQFTATITAAGQPAIRLNDEGLVQVVKR